MCTDYKSHDPRRNRARRAIAWTAATVFSLGLSGQVLAAAECENPDALTFAIIPTEETVAELQLYKPVTDRMAEMTGKKIQFFMPTSYASVVEGMLSGFVHVGVLGPYTYVIANNKDPNIEVFATYAKRPGHLQEEGPRLSRCSGDQEGFRVHHHRVPSRDRCSASPTRAAHRAI